MEVYNGRQSDKEVSQAPRCVCCPSPSLWTLWPSLLGVPPSPCSWGSAALFVLFALARQSHTPAGTTLAGAPVPERHSARRPAQTELAPQDTRRPHGGGVAPRLPCLAALASPPTALLASEAEPRAASPRAGQPRVRTGSSRGPPPPASLPPHGGGPSVPAPHSSAGGSAAQKARSQNHPHRPSSLLSAPALALVPTCPSTTHKSPVTYRNPGPPSRRQIRQGRHRPWLPTWPSSQCLGSGPCNPSQPVGDRTARPHP